MTRARKKVLIVVVAVGIVAAAGFFFSGPSASEEAAKVYGVWRVTGFSVNGQNVSRTNVNGFSEFSEKTLTEHLFIRGQPFPPVTVEIVWSFRDGTLCYRENVGDHRPFLKKLFDSAPMERRITIVDANTILRETTSTSETDKTTTTTAETLTRSSPAERDEAITKRPTSQPVTENGSLEPVE